MSQDQEKEKVSHPRLGAKFISKITGKGFLRCYCVYYSSEFQSSIGSEIVTDLYSITKREIYISTLKIEKIRVVRPTIEYIFVDQQQILEIAPCHGIMKGSYLEIAIPYYNEKEEDALVKIGMYVAAAFRLFYGENSCKQQHFSAFHDLSTGKFFSQGTVGRIGYLESPLKMDFEHSKSAGSVQLTAKERTLELVELANQYSDIAIRFIFLWLAIESQIGNGKQRDFFCKKVLKSNLVDGELRRLFGIRNLVLKEAVDIAPDVFDEYSLMSIIRISCLTEGKLRSALLLSYEKALRSRIT